MPILNRPPGGPAPRSLADPRWAPKIGPWFESTDPYPRCPCLAHPATPCRASFPANANSNLGWIKRSDLDLMTWTRTFEPTLLSGSFHNLAGEQWSWALAQDMFEAIRESVSMLGAQHLGPAPKAATLPKKMTSRQTQKWEWSQPHPWVSSPLESPSSNEDWEISNVPGCFKGFKSQLEEPRMLGNQRVWPRSHPSNIPIFYGQHCYPILKVETPSFSGCPRSIVCNPQIFLSHLTWQWWKSKIFIDMFPIKIIKSSFLLRGFPRFPMDFPWVLRTLRPSPAASFGPGWDSVGAAPRPNPERPAEKPGRSRSLVAAKCPKKKRNGGIQVIHLEFFIQTQSWGYHRFFFGGDSGAKLVFGVPPPGEHEPTHQVHHFTAAERTFSGEFRCFAMFRHTQIHYPLVQSQLLTLSIVTLW